jgi:hypothetical protein
MASFRFTQRITCERILTSVRLEGSTESGERRAGRLDHPPCFNNQVCKILAQQQPRCPGEATGLINLKRAIGQGMFGGDLFEACAFSRCCENHSIPTRLRAFNKLRFCLETHM